jgi:TatD-related deoxyribonuclease
MEEQIITDNHIHVDPINGKGPLEVAKIFHRAGGKVMIIPNKPTWTVDKSCSFEEAMELVVKYVAQINQNIDVHAFAVVGPHPAELSRRVQNGMELEMAEKMMMGTLESAQKMVMEGKAIAIGEVGRPHYEVNPEEMDAHRRVMLYAMELAADADCAVQLHTESAMEAQFLEFGEMADKAGLQRCRVIKHFSGPLVGEDETHGLTPSLIATKKVVVEGIKKGNNFLMETDFLDMDSRPGAVLGPKTVPRRTRDLLNKGILTEDDVYNIHVKNVKNVYGIDLDGN